MPKFKKGSPEAKAYMAKLRAMRGCGSFNSAALKGGRSYNSAALKGGRSYNSAALKGGVLPVAAIASAIPTAIGIGSTIVKGIAGLIRKRKQKKREKKIRAEQTRKMLKAMLPMAKENMQNRAAKMKESLVGLRERLDALKQGQA